MEEEIKDIGEITDIGDVQNAQASEGADETKAKGNFKKDKKVREAYVAAINAKIETAEKAAADAKEKMLRTAAEYENYRKRSVREKDMAFGDGVSHAVNALLSVIDTLELAANAETADEEYKKGVVMTLNKCEEAFKTLGVCEIEAMDLPFDPELHAAVMQQESDKESGTVVNVFQKGYKLNDKVIRHTSVAVAI
ncbi:MAG: nucleotide exchange factor GrpE [Oscillospiraceae bacterium]